MIRRKSRYMKRNQIVYKYITSILVIFTVLFAGSGFAAEERVHIKYRFVLQFKGMEETNLDITSINFGSNRTDVQVETRDGVIILKPGKTSYYNLSIRRPFNPNDELGLWRKDIAQGKYVKRDGYVQIVDDMEDIVAEYYLEGAWPSEQHIDAIQSVESTLMETLSFVAEKITRKK